VQVLAQFQNKVRTAAEHCLGLIGQGDVPRRRQIIKFRRLMTRLTEAELAFRRCVAEEERVVMRASQDERLAVVQAESQSVRRLLTIGLSVLVVPRYCIFPPFLKKRNSRLQSL
jgi:hypothetical protein